MPSVKVESRATNQGLFELLLAMIVAVAFVSAMAVFWREPPDYVGTYRTAAQRWVTGETQLFDAQGAGFWNAPWTLGLYIPFNGLPSITGQIATNSLSVICMMLATVVFWDRRHFSAAVLSIASLPVLFLLNNGQVDGISLAGITVGYLGVTLRKPWLLSAALVWLLIKPINVLLPGILYLWPARKWSLREWLITFTLPLIFLIASFLAAGIDWPVRYLIYLREGPEFPWKNLITSWRAADYLGLPAGVIGISGILALLGWAHQVRQNGLTRLTLALAISTNFLITIYASEYHYVLLIPAYLTLAKSRLLTWMIYLVTFVPLVRLLGGWEISWMIIAYPLILFILIWAVILKDSSLMGFVRRRSARQ